MKSEFRTPDVTAALSIPRERLQAWLNGGFITPKVSGVGHGSRTIFSREDVIDVALFNALVSDGLTREFSSKILSEVDEMERRHRGAVEVVVFGRGKHASTGEEREWVHFLEPNQALDFNDLAWVLETYWDLSPGWRVLHAVNLGALTADVDRALEGLE